MEADCYQIEVLHFINPHLIWVEVLKHNSDKINNNDDFFFEQIGIYGILPLDTTIDVAENSFKTETCDSWLPAASAVMRKALSDATEVWFTPNHIDERSSIFDNNIHKYGDILIKKSDGKLRKLAKYLINPGFAFYDVCAFHQKLSLGQLSTKLDNTETRIIIHHLEMYYKKKLIPKNHWQNAVKKHTTVFQTSQQLESALTIKNLERLNNEMNERNNISSILTKKFIDLNLCKDIEEESLGRATRIKDLKESADSESSFFLKKKIELVKNSQKKLLMKQHPTKMMLTKSQDTIDKDSDIKLDETKKQIDSVETKEMSVSKDSVDNHNNGVESETQQEQNFKGKSFHEEEGVHKKYKKRKSQNVSTTPKYDENKEKLIVYGPPGVNFSKVPLKVVPIEENFNEPINSTKTEETEETEVDVEEMKDDNLYAEVDSNISLPITNKNDLKELYLRSVHNTVIENSEIVVHSKSERPSSSLNTHSSFSTTLGKKLKLHEQMKMTKNREEREMEVQYPETDTNMSEDLKKESPCNKTDSNQTIVNNKKNEKENIQDDSDDNLDDIIKKLNLGDSDAIPEKVNKPVIVSDNTQPKVNVNPFKNIDSSISVFVDKLISPVLMVHTKMNKRIQPSFNLRDINFNDNIHVVLKNMSINRPMTLQTVSWFTILRGYSLFMVSPKCSGKTLGYIPAVCRLISDRDNEISDSVGPVCIIVCATANSVAEVERLCKMFLGLEDRVVSCYAGMDAQHITTSLLNGCDLFICTPSALVRLLHQTDFGIDLRRLTMFVLDDCEIISEVYINEVKFFQLKIKEMLKNRANRELKVQYIIASRIWSDFMKSLALKASNSVVCIGAFQECVLYAEASTTVNFVKKENKINSILEFLNQIDGSKKTVIVCRSDDEVDYLEKALKILKYVVYACNNTMTLHDLYALSQSWNDYIEPLTGPILVCCDGNLAHLNVTDAHYLIHYSLPPLFSTFCKRFSVLNDNYASIFKLENESVKIKILVEECNVEQLPKILHFIKRCTNEVPEFLEQICEKVWEEKEAAKAKHLVPICDSLLSFGECPDFWNCEERHILLKYYDEPKELVPRSGVITFKILHYRSATLYSARLLSNIVNDTITKYSQTYSILSFKMGMYYSKEVNQKLHGIPKLGDFCAVSVKQNLFARCQVIKIVNRYQNGNPNYVLIRLIDEEILERTRDIYLYHLPEELKDIKTNIIQVRLVNIRPKDKDVTFSDLARDQLKRITDKDDNLYMRGRVTVTIGNCVFVETLEACQDLTSLNETVVKHDFKAELLDKHAISNPDHADKLMKMCKNVDLLKVEEVLKSPKPLKELIKGRWAHLGDDMPTVFLTSVESPDMFFIRLVQFENCLKMLTKDIETYISEMEPDPVETVNIGDIVIAKVPKSVDYKRARVDYIEGNNIIQCFFVDHGDWNTISIENIFPITDKLITQLPFQAIECRLIGIQPAGEDWTDFCITWLSNKGHSNHKECLIQLYAKYFTKETAEYTEGHKYGIVLIDTNTAKRTVFNQVMIDLNLAREIETEIKYLYGLDFKKESERVSSSDEEDERRQLICYNQNDSNDMPGESLANILLEKPLRSVPLVDSDYDVSDDDRWNINMTEDFISIFKPMCSNAANLKAVVNLPAVKQAESDSDAPAKTECSASNSDYVMVSSSKETDSDDLTSPENAQSIEPEPEQSIEPQSEQSIEPQPRQSIEPQPTQSIEPQPRQSIEPEPEQAIEPEPEQAIEPEPEQPIEPEPEQQIEPEPEPQPHHSINPSQVDQLRKPKLCWRQNKTSVSIKILLIGVEDYVLEINDRHLRFSTFTNDTRYEFDLDLYGVINTQESSHEAKGQYILVRLAKILKKNWLSLTRDVSIKKWIVYDMDSIDTSSDEETVQVNPLNEMMRNMHYESDSEDDDSCDDINFKYQNDSD